MVKKNNQKWLILIIVGLMLMTNEGRFQESQAVGGDSASLGGGFSGAGLGGDVAPDEGTLMAISVPGSGIDLPFGTYHSLSAGNGVAQIGHQTTSFNLADYPLGDHFNPSDYATSVGESVSQSRSEVAAQVVSFFEITQGGTVKIKWYRNSDNQLLYPPGGFLGTGKPYFEHTIPDPNSESWCVWAECWWNWYSVYSWIGNFPLEYNDIPGGYRVEIETPWGSETVQYSLTGVPVSNCPDISGAGLNFDTTNGYDAGGFIGFDNEVYSFMERRSGGIPDATASPRMQHIGKTISAFGHPSYDYSYDTESCEVYVYFHNTGSGWFHARYEAADPLEQGYPDFWGPCPDICIDENTVGEIGDRVHGVCTDYVEESCNDNNVCTQDTCVDAVCQNTQIPLCSLCPEHKTAALNRITSWIDNPTSLARTNALNSISTWAVSCPANIFAALDNP